MTPGSLDIKVTIDADRASDQFKAARKEINAHRKQALEAAAGVVMPEARRRTPGFAASHLTIRATARTAFITTKGLSRTMNRVFGLLEHGGTVRTRIVADEFKGAAALKTPQGPRAAVNAPRNYKARRYLTGAIESRRPQIDEAILRETMKAFDGFDHTP